MKTLVANKTDMFYVYTLGKPLFFANLISIF